MREIFSGIFALIFYGVFNLQTYGVFISCQKSLIISGVTARLRFSPNVVIELDEASWKSAVSRWVTFFLERQKSLKTYGSQAGNFFFFKVGTKVVED